MYLNRLNSEQKELFLDLCIQAAMANNDFADEQKAYIQMYCNEMQLSEVRFEANTKFDETIAKLAEICSESELKIIVLELTALILSDHIYDELESEFMKKVIQSFGINGKQNEEMIEILKELSEIYKRLNELILS